MDAAQALADLTEVSSQIEGAVFVGTDGTLLASTFPAGRGERVGATAAELLRAAESAPAAERRELTHVVATLAAGAVFVVRSGERLVAAVTGRDPTVGLIVYDLKTCLRLAEEEAGDGRQESRA
jgi:predicted regulator of Ras-like GTPase activity (Roadblock/LC7/MglB family)